MPFTLLMGRLLRRFATKSGCLGTLILDPFGIASMGFGIASMGPERAMAGASITPAKGIERCGSLSSSGKP